MASSFVPIGHKLPHKMFPMRPVRQHAIAMHCRGQLSKYSFFPFSSIFPIFNQLSHFHKFSPFSSIYPIFINFPHCHTFSLFSSIYPMLLKQFQLTAHQRASTSQRTAAQIFLLLATSNSWQRSALMTTTMMVIMIADHDYHC